MKPVTRILALLFAVLCLLIATYLGVEYLSEKREILSRSVDPSITRDDSREFGGSIVASASTKSARTKTKAAHDIKSEVNLKKIDSGLMLARFPADYVPRQGELAYVEDIGLEGGYLRTRYVIRTDEPESSQVLFEIDSELLGSLKDGARIVFTGKMENGAEVDPALSWDEHRENLAQTRNHSSIDPDRGYAGFQFNDREGFVAVEGVIAGTPAHRAGLKEGDTILSIDGESVEASALAEVGSLSSKVIGWREGDQIEIELQRGNERHHLNLELASGLEVQKAVEAEQDAAP